MARKKEKPGVMLYFDLLPALRRLSLQEKGALFQAIMEFGQNAVVPDFDGALGIAWDFIMPRLIADDEAYREKCQTAADNANKRWRKDDAGASIGMRGYAGASDGTRTNADDAKYKDNSNAYQLNTNTETKSTATAASEGVQGESGELTLYRQWIDAMDAGDKETASALNNQLFRLGYDIDFQTKELTRKRN